MGKFNLSLNITNFELLIAISVIIVLLLSIIWIIVWIVKVNKSNRLLKQIDRKLETYIVNKIVRENIIEPTCEKAIEDRSHDDYKLVKVEGHKISEDNTKEEVSLEDQDIDVLREIQMALVNAGKTFNKEDRELDMCLARSGKRFTRQELEDLISD
ncbi:MAG: hypothetical protein PUI85_03455 [Eubacteriales bacterium]|nr:hypothetical protein [Eubacteriales bacterium]MDY3333258.1 hypothetical protein [Gallibacter sp.]